ncbi:ISAs1 family transposase [Nostoc punctiforme UO1]|uniref:ISAs1 family transposase n=1 Tax=Nostoc punctiforme TaxID=272131 RepID=UPI0030B55F35
MPKKTCELIIESCNDYVIAGKGNQPKLHSHIQRIAALRKPTSRIVEIEKTRDRLTTRTVEVFHELKGIDPKWIGVNSLIRVERVGIRKGKKYHEIVCYISSLLGTAKEYAIGIRGHWGIENRLHWVKDVVFKEDISTIRMGNAPANLSITRAIALNIIRRNSYASITIAHRFLSHDIDKLIDQLKQVEDFRTKDGRRHPLWLVLLFVTMGTMNGYVGYRGWGDFVKRHSRVLIKKFGIQKHGVPSYSTIRRVVMGVEFDKLAEKFNDWAKNYVEI